MNIRVPKALIVPSLNRPVEYLCFVVSDGYVTVYLQWAAKSGCAIHHSLRSLDPGPGWRRQGSGQSKGILLAPSTLILPPKISIRIHLPKPLFHSNLPRAKKVLPKLILVVWLQWIAPLNMSVSICVSKCVNASPSITLCGTFLFLLVFVLVFL